MNPSVRAATGAPAKRCGCLPALPVGIEALIVDFDGTLADTTASHEQALREALRPHGIELDHRWYRDHVGLSIHELLTALPFAGAGALPHAEIIAHSRTRLLADLHAIIPIPCVVELVAAARRAGLVCAVASGASAVLVVPGLAALGLADEFTTVVTRDDVARGKPAPDLFAEAARRLGVPPDACLAVDDAAGGLAAARAAGMQAITVIGGHLTHLDTSPAATSPAGRHDRTPPPAQGA